MHRFLQLILALSTLSFLIVSSCSDNSDNEVDEILLTIDKEAMLVGDTAFITTFVRNKLNQDVEDATLRYFANDIELPGPYFTTDTKGEYRISATYKDILSQRRDIDVFTLEDNVNEITLLYDGEDAVAGGRAYLTTEEWSVSGSFSFELEFGNLNFEVSSSQVDLFLDGQKVEERGGFYFPDPGIYEFTAAIGNQVSNVVSIEVREKLNLEKLRIPVIFHVLESDVSPGNLALLIDTLNSVFAVESYSKEDVINDLVNPNAVSMNIEFYLADDAPEGFDIGTPGFDGVSREFEGQSFYDLIDDHSWDPDKYVNVWMMDFLFGLEEDLPANYDNRVRGIIETPVMDNFELSGFDRRGSYDEKYPPMMAVASKSVLYDHPDYMVTTMGGFLGLFDTFQFDCAHHGDYCEDTPTIDFANPKGNGTSFVSCSEDQQFFATNFMALNRRYRDFTYDQALRVRAIVEHGHGRPRGE